MMIPRRTGPPLSAEKRRERIEKRIAIYEARRPQMKVVDERTGVERKATKAEKDRAEYVIDKQLKRQQRTLENHDRRYAPKPVEPKPEGPTPEERRRRTRARRS